MTSVAARSRAPAARASSQRLLAALPLVSAFAWLCLLHGWQAWAHRSPWLFADELDYAQLARSIAETGRPGRRGDPESFATLYAYLTAPAWLIDRTQTAYDAAKYIGVVSMTATVFPAYALARLVVSRRPALFAAVAAAAIPALTYSSLLLTETLAYPFATLCFFLVGKALLSRRPAWIAAAAAACLVAPLVRGQLAVLPAVFAGAGVLMAWSSEGARARRRGWSALEWVAAAAVILVAALVASELIGRRWGQWAVATRYPGDMLEHGIWAAGALTIGLGVLPVLTAIAVWPGRSATPAYRPFVCLLVAATSGFVLYAAAKAAYLASFFESRVVERNVIYLSPLLLAGAALWLEHRRVRLPLLAGAVALVAYLVVATPYQLDPSGLYADAPSLSILSWANQRLGWSEATIQAALLALVALVAAALWLGSGPLRGRRAGYLAAGLATVTLVWIVAAELVASDASDAFSDKLASELPAPLDWVDRATGGAPTAYLGQSILNPNHVQLLEFWNRSLEHVASLDDTAPGPGPTPTLRLADPNGSLASAPDVRYVLADLGVEPQGTPVAQEGRWTLYRLDGPLRLRSGKTGIYPDGWMAEDSAYSQYVTDGGRAGIATVTASRKGACGLGGDATVTVTIGPLVLRGGKPTVGQVTETQRARLRPCATVPFGLFSPPPPFHVRVHVTPTIVPAELDPNHPDRRRLGAQVSFGFLPGLGPTESPGGRPDPRARATPRTTPGAGTP